jgi:transmembrane sensor
MGDGLDALHGARDRIDAGWDDEQAARVLGRVHGRLRAHRTGRRVLGVVALAAVLCVVAAGGVRYGRRTAAIPPATTAMATVVANAPAVGVPVEEDAVRYPDGSAAFSTSPGTRLQLDVATADRVVTTLERGAARFEVVPDRDREFRVRMETVTVTVLGTIFTVSRGERGAHVAVQRGRVRIDSPGGTAFLEAGEQGDYAFVPAPGAAASAAPPPSSSAAGESWRALARRGRHKDAYALMQGLRPQQVGDAEDLLAAADVARLSGHPGQAIPFLERVLVDFRSDPRAPVAAFGLGRILLPSRPAAAAARFAEARALAPAGALAEDALAREVEAWSRAGAPGKARAAAAEYLRRYPQGSRASQVRELGGL